MKRHMYLAVVVALISAMFFGCAQRKAVAPESQQPAPSSAAQKSEAKAGEAGKGTEKVTEQQMAKVESRDMPSGQAEEVSGMFADIHFDYDKYGIKDEAKPVLKSVADYLIKNGSERVLIEGHCDERGTTEYNLGLGDRRAKSTKDYLVSSGVPSSRIETISYGKERPLCSEHTEECWAKNRRAHFVVMKGKK